MRPDVKERARLFVSKARPSVAGSHGHDALFAVACGLVIGFALNRADAWELLQQYNGVSCTPAWSEKDLRRKMEQAFKQAERNPAAVGHLADADRADYTGPRSPANKRPSTTTGRDVEPRGGAPPTSGKTASRTPRTPLFSIHRAGEGAKPRTSRTVRTPEIYSLIQEKPKQPLVKSSKQPSVKSAPQPPRTSGLPQTHNKNPRAALSAKQGPCDVTLILNTGEVWKNGTQQPDTLPIQKIREHLQIRQDSE